MLPDINPSLPSTSTAFSLNSFSIFSYNTNIKILILDATPDDPINNDLIEFFNKKQVRNLMNDHLKCHTNNEFKLWSLIQFNLWYEKNYKNA